jgi:hypothetical protein
VEKSEFEVLDLGADFAFLKPKAAFAKKQAYNEEIILTAGSFSAPPASCFGPKK